MARALGKPDPGTSRKITSTEAEVAGVRASEGWIVQVSASGDTRLIRTREQGFPSESPRVLALEQHWAARVKVPNRFPADRNGRPISEDARGPQRDVIRIEAHKDKRKRVEVLACGHAVTLFRSRPGSPRRHCPKCRNAAAEARGLTGS